MMFASATDMEPGMMLRTHAHGDLVEWLGFESVTSRFPGKQRIRVLVRRGDNFVCDRTQKFQVIEWRAR